MMYEFEARYCLRLARTARAQEIAMRQMTGEAYSVHDDTELIGVDCRGHHDMRAELDACTGEIIERCRRCGEVR